MEPERARVAQPKAWIRRRMISALRQQVLAGGGTWIRLAPFPYPFRSAFNFRVDLDEPVPDDYHRFALTRNLLADCCTHFVSTHAYENEGEVLSDLHRHDTQSHGHFHYVYRDPEANFRNLERADRVLRDSGFAPAGFAAPIGAGTPAWTTPSSGLATNTRRISSSTTTTSPSSRGKAIGSRGSCNFRCTRSAKAFFSTPECRTAGSSRTT